MLVFNIKPGSGHIITFAYQVDHLFYTEIYLNDPPSQLRVILAHALCTVNYVLYITHQSTISLTWYLYTLRRAIHVSQLYTSLHFYYPVIRHACHCRLLPDRCRPSVPHCTITCHSRFALHSARNVHQPRQLRVTASTAWGFTGPKAQFTYLKATRQVELQQHNILSINLYFYSNSSCSIAGCYSTLLDCNTLSLITCKYSENLVFISSCIY